MKLTYIYHSGYCIEYNDRVIVIDFYKDSDSTNGYIKELLKSAIKKLYILSTHSHHDHFVPEILQWEGQIKEKIYIFSKDILTEGKAKEKDAIYLDKLETYEDNDIFIKAYGSTDLGISFYIEFGGKTIFHAGDLNNWHWNEEVDQVEANGYEHAFLNELAILKTDVKHLDIAMFPIDPRLGKDYMKGATQFIEQINVDFLSPLHFQDNYEKAKAFETIAQQRRTKYNIITTKGQSIVL